MVFSSTTFLFVFLPAVLLLYYLIPEKHCRNALLILASLVFYAYGEPTVVVLMVISIFANYAFGLMMAGKKHIRIMGLVFSIIWNLELLCMYKYAGFFTETINHLPFVTLPVPEVKLPIGISFFTFQAMAYVIDVYRGDIQIQKNPFKLLLYITLFPQLIAGPIVKYKDIESQLSERPIDFEQTAQGIRRFIVGVAKKLVVADTVAVVADSAFAMENDKLIFSYAWLGAVCYTLQIYFDFSGYSDMALGLGKMFGFTFKENFNYPYCSGSITEFWRRWHISLSTWFKEYLYIPLGGNRKGKGRTILNKWIVFLLTGLWHGASWTFVIWGLLNGAFLTLESFVKDKFPKNALTAILKHIYCIGAVVLCFVVFRAHDMIQALSFWKAMFGFSPADTAQREVSSALMTVQLNPLFIGTLVLAIIFALPVKPFLESKLQTAKAGMQKTVNAVSYVGSMVLFGICLLYLSSGAYSPFIYLNF